jgi:molybdopterin converting factor subunit 1
MRNSDPGHQAMVRFRVRLFASLRERAGADFLEIELPEGATAGRLLERLAALRPELAAGLRRVAVAAGRRILPPEAPLPPGEEVALLPPVSGG